MWGLVPILKYEYANINIGPDSTISRIYSHELRTFKPTVPFNYLKKACRIIAERTAGIGINSTLGLKLDIAASPYTFNDVYKITGGVHYIPEDTATFPLNGINLSTTDREDFLGIYTNQDVATDTTTTPNQWSTLTGFDTILFMCSLFTHKFDVYNSYVDQIICKTDQIHRPYNGSDYHSTKMISGFDTLLVNETNQLVEDIGVSEVIMTFPTFSIFGYTNELFGDMPDEDQTYVLKLNEDDIPEIYSPYKRYSNRFPYRTAKSIVTSPEEQYESWRTFLADDYFDKVRDKGEIIFITSFGDNLIIHHKYGLYVASIKDIIGTDENSAYLGSGELFDRDPKEVLDDNGGYLSIHSRFAAIICRYGYIFISNGKVFQYDGQIKEISFEGLKDEFKALYDATYINPYNTTNGKGFTLTYDDLYRRLILSKTHSTFSSATTLSYSFIRNLWIGKHDYNPTMLFRISNQVYSLWNTDKLIYKHNTNNFTYYDLQYYKMYVDIVLNDNKGINKLIEAVMWQSHVGLSKNNPNKTFTHAIIYTNDKSTGEIILLGQSVPWYKRNIRYEKGWWHLTDIQDCVVDNTDAMFTGDEVDTTNVVTTLPFYKKGNIVDTFIVVRLQHDDDTETNQIMLSELTKKFNLNLL
jgi:hypothetical protein